MSTTNVPNWVKVGIPALLVGYILMKTGTSNGKTDWNFIFTFGVPALVIGAWMWSIYKKNLEYRQSLNPVDTADPVDQVEQIDPDPDDNSDGVASGVTSKLSKAEVASAIKTGLGDSQNIIPLDTVITHLNDRRDEVPHFMVIGGTGAGKSTFARLLLGHRVARGEQFVILAGKRTAVFADLPSIGRDAISADGTLKFDRVRAVSRSLLGEVVRRDNMDFDNRKFKVLNIVIDDASILMSEIDEVVQLARVVGLLGREIDMRLIILTGSMLVKELGFEGRGDLRDHFGIVTYRKNLDASRNTLFRPRYDEKENWPFDSDKVPTLARRMAIDARQAWVPTKGDQSSWLREDDVVFTGLGVGEFGIGAGSNSSNNNSNNNGIDKLSKYTDILRRLKKGESQHIISSVTGASLATVNQIAQAMNYVEEEKV